MPINKVAIGVSGGELARYSVFYDSLLHLRGITSENVIHVKGGSIAENRNIIQQTAEVRGYDAILYLDDDQVLPPTTLERLIAHDVDVVSALYLKREPPFIPHAYHHHGDNHWSVHCLTPFTSGLTKVDMVGAGCLLVKMGVFAKLPKPYWTLGQGAWGRENAKAVWADDECFCRNVRSAGFDIHIDFDTPIGHQLSGSIWPARQPNGEWQSVFITGKHITAAFPAARVKTEGDHDLCD